MWLYKLTVLKVYISNGTKLKRLLTTICLTLFIMSHLIQAFLPSGGRAKNDANNRVREDALIELAHMNDDISECSGMKQGLDTTIATLCPLEFSRYRLTKKAGRGHNYDFDLAFCRGDKVIYTTKLEFKYGSTSVEKLPQFYQKNTGWEITPVLYHEFFYDGPYLEEIRMCCADAPEKPDRETYMRHIMKTAYNCHPFFQYLYDNESTNKKEKADIVKRSIRDFLALYGSTINIEAVKQTFDKTQADKQYLLYDHKSRAFCCQSCDFLGGGELTFVCVKKNNVVVITNGVYEFHLLLRWKNHQGILNPAWQVSVKKQV